MRKFTMKRMSDTREIVTFKNEKEETVQVEIVRCEDCSLKNSLPKLWKKNGFIDRVLETYWHMDVSVIDKDGNCWIKYNPQIKPSDDGKRYVINFSWMLEATKENKKKLIAEVERLAFA